jgi:glycosyltransferase involved in cell wall biosynthesis
MTSARVPVLIVLPADPERLEIGGIASFVRGFVKFAPDDFDIGFLGVTPTRPLWRWGSVQLEGRAVGFMPVVRRASAARGRMPISLQFTASVLAGRGRLATAGWVLSFHRPGTDLALGGHAPRWRVVHLTVDDLATAGSESRWRRLARPLEWLERRSFRRMDRIYVVNERAAAAYRRRFPEVAERIEFLPNWVDSTIFRPSATGGRPALRAGLRARLNLADDGPMVLYAGRLEGQKDPILLARAFAQLLSRRPTAALLVAGEGTLRDPMQAELHRLGAAAAVRFLGTLPRDQLAELMDAADCLIITSRFETGPTVGLEALACGLPVVTTAVGQVAKLVEDSQAGAVVADRQPSTLADALERALAEPAGVMREAALRAAEPYRAARVLGSLYDDNRALAERLRRPPSSASLPAE